MYQVQVDIDTITTSGKILDRLGNMKTFDFCYKEAEPLLREAEECMRRAGSETGRARVQHHIAILL